MKLMLILLLSMVYQGAHCAPHKQLFKLYESHRTTFFCEQPFSPTGEVNTRPTKHHPALVEKIQWMPIVPLKKLSSFYACYQQKCVNKKGKIQKGMRCCQNDAQFNQMQQDLHNWVPETRQLKQQRERYAFAELPSTLPKKLGCHFVIDKKTKQLEPAPSKRGMIARTYLYMKDTYPFRLTDKEMALYLKWHQQYPVTKDERERNERIGELQGRKNHYVN